MTTSDAIESPNACYSNRETENAENVADAIESLAYSAKRIADAITPVVQPGTDVCGGTVDSLTEAVMGITAGMVKIAEAISDLAEAVRWQHQQ